MEDYIRICDVEKYYGNGANVTKAVDRVSFTVDKGEFVGVMGDCGIIGLNRKNLTNTGVLRHSPISLTRKGWLKNCHTDLIKQRCN